ncbi:MAG TPA: sulfatase-like hydrolase/transferase [Burkholderiales bacterium]|nr:sulfatase-like hydrolase/transferase [Burkholderiales bacterium]
MSGLVAARSRAPLAGYTMICLWPAAMFVAREHAQGERVGPLALAVACALSGLLWLGGMLAAQAVAASARGWPHARTLTVLTLAVFELFAHETLRYILAGVGIGAAASAVLYLALVSTTLAAISYFSVHEAIRSGVGVTATLLTLLATMHALGSQALAPPPSAVAGEPRFQPVRASTPRNVYLVVLDGYAGPAALLEHLGYDVQPFIAQMQALGYVHVEHARANYTTTYTSIMAMLAMDYVVDDTAPPYTSTEPFFPAAWRRDGLPAAPRSLAAGGYDVLHVGNLWVPCKQSVEVECLGASELGWAAHTVYGFFSPTKIPQRFARAFFDPGGIPTVLRAVPELTSRKRPFLAFVHHLSPHAPYVHADCSTDYTLGDEREKYKQSITCVNALVLELAKALAARDPEAIVLFQADHGSDFNVPWKQPFAEWGDVAIDERTSILSLVRVPDACRRWIPDDLSPLNAMRLALGCLEDRQPVYLPERSYLTTYPTFPDFGRVRDVSARLLQHAARKRHAR